MAPAPRFSAHRQTIRRQFDARAARFGTHDAIVREVEARLVERLSYIRHQAGLIVDLGCGRGAARAALARRFADAQWIGVDLSERMLLAGRAIDAGGLRWPWRRRRPLRACASADALPLADGCADVVFSNLMLHWHPAPHEVFVELARVLRVGGLLIFSCFGPDTLKELRAACAGALAAARPVPYVDMHDFGDMMLASGFVTPVMEAETLRLTYAGAAPLLAEVRALGGNPRDDRGAGLVSGARARALLAAIEGQRGADGRVGLSFEVAYGHGWKAAARSDGIATIELRQLRDRLPRG